MSSPQNVTPAEPFPPGLEPAVSNSGNTAPVSPDQCAQEMRAAAMDTIEVKLNQLSHGNGEDRQSIIEDLRRVVVDDVDARVQQKANELWQRGKQMLTSIQTKHKEKMQKLADEVAKCNEKQQLLEQENAKLKTVLNTLSYRFNLLGQVFSGQKAAMANSADAGAGETSTLAPTSPPQTQDTASELFTPGATSAGEAQEPASAEAAAATGENALKLPEVPAFPFPAASPASPAAPLLLSEALGPQTPQRTPLSLVNSLTPSSAGPELFSGMQRNQQNTYSFTLRKADNADLGLNVSHHDSDRVLRVEGVRPEGAVEAWNRQCGGASAEKAVRPGDSIISVNNITYEPTKMLQECKEKQLLRLTIMRGPATSATEATPKASAPVKATTLRAEASVFVPQAVVQAAETSPATEEKEAETSEETAADATPERV